MKYFPLVATAVRLGPNLPILLLAVVLVGIGTVPVIATPQDESLEDRLDRVESNLERLIGLLAAALEGTVGEDVKRQLESLADELKTIRRQASRVEDPAPEEEAVPEVEALVVAEVVAAPDAPTRRRDCSAAAYPCPGTWRCTSTTTV